MIVLNLVNLGITINKMAELLIILIKVSKMMMFSLLLLLCSPRWKTVYNHSKNDATATAQEKAVTCSSETAKWRLNPSCFGL